MGTTHMIFLQDGVLLGINEIGMSRVLNLRLTQSSMGGMTHTQKTTLLPHQPWRRQGWQVHGINPLNSQDGPG